MSSTHAVPAVETFAPWAEGEERNLRVRVHHARDIAQARACRTQHGRSRVIYWLAAQMAGDWVFQRADVEDLRDVLHTLTRLFLSATAIERLESPDV